VSEESYGDFESEQKPMLVRRTDFLGSTFVPREYFRSLTRRGE